MARSDMLQQSIPVLLLTVLIGYGAWSQSQALRTARYNPEDPTSAPETPKGILDARLWQDPLMTLRTFQNGHKDDKPKAPEIAIDSNTLVLGVITYGGGYPEDCERRLRDRFAVVNALGRAGLIPEDAEHIRWCTIGVTKDRETAAQKLNPLDVPYECFYSQSSATSAANEAIVFWLSDAEFSGPDFETRLSQLITVVPSKTQWPILMFGPISSDGLVQLTTWAAIADRGQDSDASQGATKAIRDRLKWYSHSATIPRRELEKAVTNKLDPAVGPPQPIPAALSLATRTIAQDDQLAQEMLAELELRRAIASHAPAEGGRDRTHRVALIAEWDTSYGRAMARTFGTTIGTRASVDVYWVLRGIDGVTSADRQPPAPAQPAGASQDSNLLHLPAPPADRPAGRSQCDYLRRLVDRIRDADDNRAEADGPVSVIGVLGTDVYDKLLILEALRPYFPDAVFFTTDLDARFLMPDQTPWTKNLVVASSYGLRLAPSLQGGTPPFRDCYQTSLYRTVLRALHESGRDESSWPPTGEPPIESVRAQLAAPCRGHVYEIGRTRAWKLGPDCDPASDGTEEPTTPILAAVSNRTYAMAAGVMLLLFLVYAHTTTIVECSVEKEPKRRLMRSDRIKLALGVVVCIGLWWLVTFGKDAISVQPSESGGEPFAWFEGISVWPSEMIRVAVIVLSLTWALTLLGQWRRGIKDVQESFGLRPFSPRRGWWQDRLVGLKAGRMEVRDWWRGFKVRDWWTRFKFKDCWTELKGWLEGWMMERKTRLTARLMKARAWWRTFKVRDWWVAFKVKDWWRGVKDWWRRIGVGDWFITGWHYEPGPQVDADTLWGEYVARSRTGPRLLRVLILTTGYFYFTKLLFESLHSAARPCRGEWSFTADLGVVIASTVVSGFLTLLVWDAVRLCFRFTRFLTSQERTRYSPTTLKKVLRTRGLDAKLAPSWLDIKLIAARTDAVSRALYYPLAALFGLIVARSVLFDNWHWGTPVLLALGANAAVAVFSVWILQKAAKEARQIELKRVNQELATVRAQLTWATGDRATHLNAREVVISDLVKEIEGIREGAFAPLTENPIFGALILPSAGTLAIWLSEMFGRIT